MAQDSDFRLDREDWFKVGAAAQLDQPRRQTLRACQRVRRFREPEFLFLVTRLELMHFRPLPPAADSSKPLPKNEGRNRNGCNFP